MSNDIAKAQATRLAEFLASKYGFKLRHAGALEAIAHIHGVKDWNHLAAQPVQADQPQVDARPWLTLLNLEVGRPFVRFDQGADALHHLLEDAGVQAVDLHWAPEGSQCNVWARTPYDRSLVGKLTEHEYDEVLFLLSKISRLRSVRDPSHPVHFDFDADVCGVTRRVTATLLPTAHPMPHLVMRIRASEQSKPKLSVPGLDALQNMLVSAPGLALVVGATGSGTTTTLETAAIRFEQCGLTVLRLGQEGCGLGSSVPLTFGNVHRALLPQGPDVLVVDSLDTSADVQLLAAALSAGKRVLAGVHSVSPHSSLRRVRDLGLTAYEIRKYMLGALHQQQPSRGSERTTLVTQLALFQPSDFDKLEAGLLA